MGVWYIDSTLRDGEQAPGVSFTAIEKFAIAALLDELNIDEAEIGTPAMGKNEIEIMHNIATAGFGFHTTSWCRALETDIQAAVRAGTNRINISFPVSHYHLDAMGKDEKWIYRRISEMLSIATDNFSYVAVGLQDASRADFSLLKNSILVAVDCGAGRIRIADTVGCMNPFSTKALFSGLLTEFPLVDFEFHGHNDLGMATANSLAAYLSGAKSISTTVNGLGERAGNAPLEEVVMALKYSANLKPSINTKKIQEISDFVARASGRPIHASKPITGEKVFQHESGIHASSLIKNRNTYQLIDSETVGRSGKPEIVFGKHSGANALADFYGSKGLILSKNLLGKILDQVKVRSSIKKANLPEEELMELYYQLT